MTTLKSLPARPSLDSLRKQAKQLARHIAGGNAAAIARARTQLPNAELPLSHRDAQLVLAREYGFAGWQQLLVEVHNRLGQGLEWAASRAKQIIQDDDVEKLKELLAEHPALLSWHGDRNEGGLLGMATTASPRRCYGVAHLRHPRRSNLRSRARRAISSQCSPASGRCQTTCLTQPAWGTSSE
jgi:hypothetical protein